MKKIFIIALLSLLNFSSGISQIKIDTINWKTTKEPVLSNENFFFTNSDVRWKSNIGISLYDITLLSNPHGFFQTDIIVFRWKYINLMGLTRLTNSNPFKNNNLPSDISYIFPFGFRYPLVCGEKYTLSFNSNFYLFPWNTTYLGPQVLDISPRFIDMQLHFEYKYGLALIAGYRTQLSEWNYSDTGNEIYYKNNISGIYFGLKLGLSYLHNKNEGRSKWLSAKKENSVRAYKSFLNAYPVSRYTNESLYQIEYLTYKQALGGGENECDIYLQKYPNGNYNSFIERRKESIAFNKAFTGDINDCDNYLTKYPAGLNISRVKQLRQDKIDQIEFTCYNNALSGTLKDCDNYLKKYPVGKYISEIKILRNENLNLIKKAQAKIDKNDLETIINSASQILIKAVFNDLTEKKVSKSFLIPAQRPLFICLSLEECKIPDPLGNSGIETSIYGNEILNFTDTVNNISFICKIKYNAELKTQLLDNNLNPVTTLRSDENGFIKNDEFINLIIGGSIKISSSFEINKIPFSFENGSASFSDFNSQAVFTEGSLCDYNGVPFIFSGGKWRGMYSAGN